MKTPLLKGNNFNQNFQQLVLKIQSIRKKNDQYQRLASQQIDQSIAQQILDEKYIMDSEVEQTKRLIEEIENNFKQLPQKNKLKQAKKQFEKQASRYKQISETLMQKSVIKGQMRNSRKSVPIRTNQNQERYREVRPNRQSNRQIAQQKQLDVDYDFQHKILMERKNELGKVEQQFQKHQQIHNDMSNMVNEQGNMVDIIGQEMLKAHQNVEKANQELVQASIQQKKSRKKWCCVVFVILLLIIMGLGAGYMFMRPSS